MRLLTPLHRNSMCASTSTGTLRPFSGSVASTNTNIESLARISTLSNRFPTIPSTFRRNIPASSSAKAIELIEIPLSARL